ncbi:MAG: hypothetical protein FWH22_10330 [Fibromonadales bacterium]|nr:hypothetical protein [Fibromonadales bacterium]
MESVFGLIFSAENIRMLVLLVFGFSCFIWLKTIFEKRIDGVEISLNKRIDGVETSLNKRIDGVESSLNKKIDAVESSLLRAIDEKINAFHSLLKYNDFAHLNNTIEALTFTLEKNGFLKREDKEYIDGRLDK